MRRATGEELARWDELVAANPDGGNVLQTQVYGEFKAAYGWRPQYIIHELPELTVAALYLARAVPGLGELWYAPKGPGVATAAQLQAVLANFKAPRAFMLKLEPDLEAETTSRAELEKLGLVKAKFDLQWNRHTVVIDLRPSEDDILAGFKQKTRYNIRLAERKGVKVRPVELTEANITQMYDLMLAVQARAGFYMRSREYLAQFWQMHTEAGRGQLFFATYEGQVLAGVFALYEGKQGLYKDGGSLRDHSELQAPYLLQWEVMRWLKARGYREYDLHGTPPHDRLDDRSHPLAGLAQFKTGFNPGHLAEYVGVYDLPLKPLQYELWQRAGEKLMAGYSFRVKHELFY
jgi:lipid II:glycine glycyltransferase (peptidoglycan interpeptide bridge formation enzyme)